MEAILRNMLNEMKHTVKRSDVQSQFNYSLLSLNNDVMPGLKSMDDLVKLDNIRLSDLPEFSVFNRNSGIKAKDIKGLIKGMVSIISSMERQSNDIGGLIETILPEIISKDIITVRQATLLNVINNYNSVALFTLDLLLYLVTLSDVKINDVENDMVKPKIAEIRTDMVTYGNILAFFNNNTKIAKDIVKVSTDKLLIDGKDISAINVLSSNSHKMHISGFIGNPIYHVRMWLVDLEMSYYEYLKEKKKLLELKILDLKAKNDGEHNPKLTKSIAYYENKLGNVEHSMRNIEES